MTEEIVYPRLRQKDRKYSRVQKKGQVTIPLELRTKMGIEEGDVVTFSETPDGILISSQEAKVMRALDELGDILREEGVTLDDLIESGRQIREEIAREKYGHLFDR